MVCTCPLNRRGFSQHGGTVFSKSLSRSSFSPLLSLTALGDGAWVYSIVARPNHSIVCQDAGLVYLNSERRMIYTQYIGVYIYTSSVSGMTRSVGPSKDEVDGCHRDFLGGM